MISAFPDCIVLLSSDGPLSIEMEKVLNSLPAAEEKVKAERVLEINAGHPVFGKLQALYADPSKQDRVKAYAGLLYNQALLIEGLPIEDPVAFSNSICELMQE